MLRKAYLEITNICNLSCSFCPGTKREKAFMTAEQFRILATKLRPHTQYLYLHLLGEPLLHPQLKEILRIVYPDLAMYLLTENAKMICGETVVLDGGYSIR